MRFLTTLILVSLAPAIISQAFAQSSRDVSNRLNRIETEIDTLNRALYRGENPPPIAGGAIAGAETANIEIRLQQLEEQIRFLTGQVEEANYKTRQLEMTLEKLTGDFNLRLSDLEAGRNGAAVSSGAFGAPSPIQPPATISNSAVAQPGVAGYEASGAGADDTPYEYATSNIPQAGALEVLAEQEPAAEFNAQQLGTLNTQQASLSGGDPAGIYENAFSFLKNANYAAAEQGFQGFLDQYPDHILAGNAKYWLGETYYVRGDYEQAARVFAEGYQQYPEGSKMPDNLLKLGLSLAAVGNTKDACTALQQLRQGDIKGAGPVLRRAEQEIEKLGC